MGSKRLMTGGKVEIPKTYSGGKETRIYGGNEKKKTTIHGGTLNEAPAMRTGSSPRGANALPYLTLPHYFGFPTGESDHADVSVR